ncbi:Similar to hypothetical protein [Botryotinia fuckeliana]; acc. no. CCD43663 [Pyronema omphalodes CBS 100304]|uniref:Uncharacterized protein n=1 Tax=Pyronema omphalodes (strain CBS 100304) TaxID=1076935 RepID=U4LTX1_PYROM|nr:Similar to hypothetical protein [Botryotinia fuckeliana]; acc. no. CCD43663 [Pyronema omphalodes CBS 100304]
MFDHHGTAREMRITFEVDDASEIMLFSEIRRCYHTFYGWRRYFSLKSLAGFKLYCCEGPSFTTHTRPETDPEVDVALAQLYRVCKHKGTWLDRQRKVRTAWVVRIDNNLNGGSRDPNKISFKTLGLEQAIEWNATIIVVLTAVPVIASFIIGMAYGEITHDRQTGWGIASCIVTVTGAGYNCGRYFSNLEVALNRR